MSNTVAIVTVNASVVQAPAPSNLQQTGAFVTQGGTSTDPSTLTLVSTLAELVALLAPAKPITTISWTGGTVTVDTTAAHGWSTGDVLAVTIAGVTPSAYNGDYMATVVDANTVTYALASNPGVASVPGSINLQSVAELRAMGTTYFAGNGVPSVYVAELGPVTVTNAVAALTTLITNIDGTDSQVYSYLVPKAWDNNAAFLTLCQNNSAVDSMLYFYVTTTVANRAVYSGPAYKGVFAQVTSPLAPATEFSLASAFGTALKANPSSTNKLGPMSYSPSFGTTAYPIRGNQATFAQLAAANVGWIGTGQQGGISGNIIFQGKLSDGNAWNFWYSVDWAQVNMARAIANEVINGSASSLNPLYYNQNGIDRLQNRVRQIAVSGIASGLGNGQVISTKLPVAQFLANYNAGLYNGQIVINAEPFLTYASENPADYGNGKYAGLSCIWIPQLPFLNIFFNLQATTLVVSG